MLKQQLRCCYFSVYNDVTLIQPHSQGFVNFDFIFLLQQLLLLKKNLISSLTVQKLIKPPKRVSLYKSNTMCLKKTTIFTYCTYDKVSFRIATYIPIPFGAILSHHTSLNVGKSEKVAKQAVTNDIIIQGVLLFPQHFIAKKVLRDFLNVISFQHLTFSY